MAGQRFNSGQVSDWGVTRATRPRFIRPRTSGNYHQTARQNVLMTMTLDRLYLIPAEFIPDYGYTELGTRVTTQGGTGRVIRIGIYESGSENSPGNLIVDGGTVSVETTGFKAVTFTALKIPSSMAFIGIVMQGGSGAACAIHGVSNNGTISATGIYDTNGETQGGSVVDSTSGSLPSSLESATFVNLGQPYSVVYYR